MSGSNAVDLSRLPPPSVIEELSFEAIVAAAKAQLIAADPTLEPVLALESEPLVKLIEVFAYREIMMRQRVNDAARAVMTAFAQGSDLDHLGALVGVIRLELEPADPINQIPAVMESDDSLRRRIVLAPEGFSVAGPAGAYEFHALSAAGDVLDASATSPNPGEVVVTILARTNGGVADQALIDAVAAAVSADDVRPLTDQVSVQAAGIVPFTVEASITTFSGPDTSLVMDEAARRLDVYLEESFRLGRDVTRSGLFAALHPEGVHNVVLTSPAADVVVDDTEAARCDGITLTYAGHGE